MKDKAAAAVLRSSLIEFACPSLVGVLFSIALGLEVVPGSRRRRSGRMPCLVISRAVAISGVMSAFGATLTSLSKASLSIVYFIINFVNIVNGDVTGDVTKKQLATVSFCKFSFLCLDL